MEKKWYIAITLWLSWTILYCLVNVFVHDSAFYSYETIFDSWFPFIPFFSLIYISMFFVIWIPIFELKDMRAYVYGFISVIAFTLPFFLFFPSQIVRPEFAVTGFFTWLMSVLYAADFPHNLFPSTHVSLVLFSALVYNKKWYYGVFALIALSTLFTKQHFVLDVMLGLIVGTLGYLVYEKFR